MLTWNRDYCLRVSLSCIFPLSSATSVILLCTWEGKLIFASICCGWRLQDVGQVTAICVWGQKGVTEMNSYKRVFQTDDKRLTLQPPSLTHMYNKSAWKFWVTFDIALIMLHHFNMFAGLGYFNTVVTVEQNAYEALRTDIVIRNLNFCNIQHSFKRKCLCQQMSANHHWADSVMCQWWSPY